MGFLTTGATTVVFDDRVLAHLQVVIVLRFRNEEPVLLSWLDQLKISGGGRSTLWMSPLAPTYFKFIGSRQPRIEQPWIDRLMASASSSGGLVVTDQAGQLIPGVTRPSSSDWARE